MDLTEFSKKSPSQRFKEINKILDKRYGVKINESGSTHRLGVLKNILNESINGLKDKGHTSASSDELNRFLLMKEAVDLELSGRLEQEFSDFGEDDLEYRDIEKSPAEKADEYQERIIRSIAYNMCEVALRLIEMGDSYQYAVDCVMREYKRSPLMYDESYIRNHLESYLSEKIESSMQNQGLHGTSIKESKEMSQQINEKRKKFMKELRTVLESGVEEAEVIIGTRSFSKSLQEMIEKIGRLQNEDLPPLTDEIRSNYGIEEAGEFHEKTQSTLQSVLDALYFAKEEIDRTVQSMADGRIEFDVDMDLDVDADIDQEDMSADIDSDESELDSAISDLEDADEGEPLGRVQKEGKTYGVALKNQSKADVLESIKQIKAKLEKYKAKK